MSSYYGTGPQQNQRQRRGQQSGQQTPQQQQPQQQPPPQLPNLDIGAGQQTQNQAQGSQAAVPSTPMGPALPQLSPFPGLQSPGGQGKDAAKMGAGGTAMMPQSQQGEMSPGWKMWEEAQESFGETMQAHEDSWGDVQQGLQAQQSQDARRAAETNAAMGGGLGGAFQGGMAQASMNTATRMADARHQHNLRGLELRMTMLQNQIQRAQQLDDMELTRELQAEADKTALAIAKMNSQVQLTGMGMQMNENGEIVPNSNMPQPGSHDQDPSSVGSNITEAQVGNPDQPAAIHSAQATADSQGAFNGAFNDFMTQFDQSDMLGPIRAVTGETQRAVKAAMDRYMADYLKTYKNWPSQQDVFGHIMKLLGQGSIEIKYEETPS